MDGNSCVHCVGLHWSPRHKSTHGCSAHGSLRIQWVVTRKEFGNFGRKKCLKLTNVNAHHRARTCLYISDETPPTVTGCRIYTNRMEKTTKDLETISMKFFCCILVDSGVCESGDWMPCGESFTTDNSKRANPLSWNVFMTVKMVEGFACCPAVLLRPGDSADSLKENVAFDDNDPCISYLSLI